MKHKVCINIAKPGGTPIPVVRSGTVQTVEIRGLREGGKDRDSQSEVQLIS